MTDPRLRVVPDPPEEPDYGEGKTRRQEEIDSMTMLAGVVMVVLVVLAVLAILALYIGWQLLR